jgi:vitamin B12 transporter
VSIRNTIITTVSVCSALLAGPGGVPTAAAQAPGGPDPDGAMAAAAVLEAFAPDGAGDRDAAELRAAADEAERRYRDLLRSDEHRLEARVGLAQVLVRCQLRHAGPMRIMALVEEAERELRSVLVRSPEHWDARFLLALTLHNMPAMLGRADDARREFEVLIAQQGASAAAGPRGALPFVHLGDHHLGAGRRAAAVEVWRRGLALFPGHPMLAARLESAGGPVEPDSSWLAAGGRSPLGADPDAGAAPIYALAPLRIEASNHQFHETRSGTTLRRLDVYTMPGGTGEMLQALQAMPGATRASDGAELYIRGGDPAETPVFFDGGRLAFPGRWESLHGSAMGVVDASVLRRAYFSSGGFSARYGNALSGVVDVETEGRPASGSYRLGVNMVQAGGSLRAPLTAASGAWATASATDVRLVAAMNGERDVYRRAPQSVQAIGGLSVEPLPGVELRGTGLSVGDRFTRRVSINGHEGDLESGSVMQHLALSARALRPDGRRGVAAGATVSRRASGLTLGVLDRDREDLAVGGRLETDAIVGARTRLRAGSEITRYSATAEGRVPLSPSLAPGSPFLALPGARESTVHAGTYAEAEHEPVPGLAVAVGLRADRLPGEDGVTVDPRAAAAYTGGDWTVRVGGGLFHQGRWRAGYRLPDPGHPAGVPRRARHLVAGVERGGALSLRVEAYVKEYDDYVDDTRLGLDPAARPDGAPAGSTTGGPAAVAGRNTGLDAIARWAPRSGPVGWLAYSLLRGRVELVDGRVVPSALDVTHSLTAVARLPLGDRWEAGATARYATGKPFTPVVGGTVDEATGAPVPVHGPIHGERLPDHRRLDARVTRYFFGPDRSAVAYVEMLNLLDRRNVIRYTYGNDFSTRVPVDAFFAHRTFVLGVELQFN